MKTEFLTRNGVCCNQVIVQLWQCLLLLFKIAHICCWRKNHSSKIFLPLLYFVKWKFRCWLASLVLPLVWFISLALVIHSLNINTIFNQHHQPIGRYHPQYFPKVSFWCWNSPQVVSPCRSKIIIAAFICGFPFCLFDINYGSLGKWSAHFDNKVLTDHCLTKSYY